MYREAGGCLQYELLRIIGNEVYVVLPSGKLNSSSINVVVPYHEQVTKLSEDRMQKEHDHAILKGTKHTKEPKQHRMITWSQKRDEKMSVVLAADDTETQSELFEESREKEITALL